MASLHFYIHSLKYISISSLFLHSTKALLNRKYTVYWVIKSNEDVLEIIMELPQQCTVNDLIASSIPIFNKTLQDMGIDLNMTLDVNKYRLYTAKKSGHPKIDYPSKQIFFFYIMWI